MLGPPLLFVHGAATAAWVWDAWRAALAPLGWETIVLDLRGHGRSLPVDFATVTMDDYVADLESVTAQITAHRGQHPVVVGWGMGGLLAMMYAVRHPETPALILISPRPPEQVTGRADPEEVRRTPIDAYGVELYGIGEREPPNQGPLADLTPEEASGLLASLAEARESGFARRQRLRGISVPPGAVRAPVLVVFGAEDAHFAPDLNRRLALYLAAESLEVPGAGHWGIVSSWAAVEKAASQVDAWLRRSLPGSGPSG